MAPLAMSVGSNVWPMRLSITALGQFVEATPSGLAGTTTDALQRFGLSVGGKLQAGLDDFSSILRDDAASGGAAQSA